MQELSKTAYRVVERSIFGRLAVRQFLVLALRLLLFLFFLVALIFLLVFAAFLDHVARLGFLLTKLGNILCVG